MIDSCKQGCFLHPQFTSWVDAVIFVFSLENEASFNAVRNYYTKMTQLRNMQEVPIILVGTQGEKSRVQTESQRGTLFLTPYLFPNRRHLRESSSTGGRRPSPKAGLRPQAEVRLLRDLRHLWSQRGESLSRW